MKADFAVTYMNTVCTLKCKHCIALTPYHNTKIYFSTADIKKDIDAVFRLYEYVGHFDFEGGETLLQPELSELITHALKYRSQFKQLNILTNATILPPLELFEVCKSGNVFFVIGDYGEKLSVKLNELQALLEKHGINYRCDVYHGDKQYYNGWIDFGDFKYKNLSAEQLKDKACRCYQSGNVARTMNGKLYKCTIQMAHIKHIPLKSDEYIDLHDASKTTEEQIKKWQKIRSGPVAACNYCNGFLTDGPRVPAAEQFAPGELTDEMKFCP
ncbi:MAG: radical SAM protein [Dysgonamonadaceae bacterium]|jgi:sulfatase maturation enzyme AslB (radical SAM superfamily)|nr:radical SAM protein [Dysgonamonadaceae bacterium]